MKTRDWGFGIILILAMLFLLCVAPVQAQSTRTISLTWDANSEPDMSHYIVYWGTASGNYTQNSGNIGLVTVYSREITPPADSKTTYYFAVTAVDTSGLESDFSNEVYQEFDTRVPPAAPKNARWYEKVISWIKGHLKFWS
jgi:fibronectin type 3 domain-containing protein